MIYAFGEFTSSNMRMMASLVILAYLVLKLLLVMLVTTILAFWLWHFFFQKVSVVPLFKYFLLFFNKLSHLS